MTMDNIIAYVIEVQILNLHDVVEYTLFYNNWCSKIIVKS